MPALDSIVRQRPKLRLRWASIAELEEGLKNRQFTTEELVTVLPPTKLALIYANKQSQTLNSRIEDVNPKVHAVAVINPDAIEMARQSDERREAGERARILEGIPIMLKDVFLTDDKMPSTGIYSTVYKK